MGKIFEKSLLFFHNRLFRNQHSHFLYQVFHVIVVGALFLGVRCPLSSPLPLRPCLDPKIRKGLLFLQFQLGYYEAEILALVACELWVMVRSKKNSVYDSEFMCMLQPNRASKQTEKASPYSTLKKNKRKNKLN